MGSTVKEGIMPKEFITPPTEGPLEAAVKVGWSKEIGHVEVAVVQAHEGHYIEHQWEAEEANAFTPLYIQMDRYSINRLIRTLRKARDDAFGKDE